MQFSFSIFFLFHSFALFYNKTNKALEIYFLLFLLNNPTRTWWISILRIFIYFQKPASSIRAGTIIKLFLIVLSPSANISVLAKCGKTIFPCINYADLIDQTAKFKLIIFLFILFFLYIFTFQSQPKVT